MPFSQVEGAMNFIKVSLAVVSFLLSFLTWPVYSQELWKIYHVDKNEQVYFILQTRQVLDAKNFDEYNSVLVGRLTLRYPHTIEPLFIGAPSIKKRLERHRFWRSQIWDGRLPYIQVGRKMFVENKDIETFINDHKKTDR